MRTLNPKERRLLGILGALLFVLLNVLLIRTFSTNLSRLQGEIQRLDGEVVETNRWLAQEDYWAERHQWILQHAPPVYEVSTSDTEFVEAVQKGLASHNLSIRSQRPGEPQRQGVYTETSMELELQGSLEDLIRWMATIQRPGNYYAIKDFTLKSDEDATKVVASLQLSRFFSTKGASQSE